jgi:transcriptional regulator with XRE-family HTH domain
MSKTIQVNAEALKSLRVREGLTQNDLAQKAGVNVSTIRRLEANGRISTRAASLIAEALGVKAGELVAPGDQHSGRNAPDLVEVSDEEQKQVADMDWANRMCAAGRWRQYAGRYVAVLNKEVVGDDHDPVSLLATVARQHGAPEERVVILFVESGAA